MKNSIVNARELFLLCALRKDAIVAINQTSYDWTFRHHSFAVDKAMAERKKDKSFGQAIEDHEDEARHEIPSQEIKKRRFSLHEVDIGFTLCDIDEDLSWYGAPNFPRRDDIKDWVYQGNFILLDPMTEKEKFIIKNFGSYV